MDSYKTQSTSANSAQLVDPVVIEETGTTRKVIVVDFNDKKRDIGETVGITFVHQRKKGKSEWENVQSISLSSLKGGDGVKLNLDSKTTRKVYDELTKLYALMDKEGVTFGIKDFTIAKAGELIKVPQDRKTLIEKLLSENHADEVWQELLSSNPDLATRLSLARVQTNRIEVLTLFKNELDECNADEGFWQTFFENNDWIFGYGLNYQFLHLLKGQPDFGGRNYTGKGSQKGDFLMASRADAKFTVLVEIKTPATQLLSYSGKEPKKIINPRNDVWLLSGQLISAISQIQVNTRTWAVESQKAENIRALESKDIFTVEPKGILIIGHSKELKGNESIISCVESFRRNITNPEIITFDELYERARFIVNNAIQTDQSTTATSDNDFPF